MAQERFIPVRLQLTADSKQFQSLLGGMNTSAQNSQRQFKTTFDRIEREGANSARALTRDFNQFDSTSKRVAKNTESHFSSALQSIKNKASGLSGSIGGILKGAGGFIAGGLGLSAITGGLDKIKDMATAVYDTREQLDRATISFETMLKSPEKAIQLVSALKQIRNETAGDLTVLADGARRLIGNNVSLEQTTQILKGLSVGARALGVTNQELDGIFTAASQVIGKGKLQAEELEQFSERGFGAARSILAEALGLSTENLIELGEQGRIKGLESIEVLARTLQEKYPQAAKNATRTIGGSIDEMTQKLKIAAVDSADPAFNRVRDGLVKLNEELTPERLKLGSNIVAGAVDKTISFGEASIKALISGDFSALKGVGSAAVSSLKEGVEAAKDKAISAGTAVADFLVGGVKGGLDMHSPSKVMIGLGEDATFSLGDGISNDKSLKRVSDSADKITKTLIDRTSEGMKKWAKQIALNGGEAFLKAVEEMAARLKANPNQILNVMAFESRLNPAQKNLAGGSASGLIQFMPDTAERLGTTTDKLRAMNAIEQLKYVEKYFKQFGDVLKSQEAVYGAVLGGKITNNPNDILFRNATGKAGRNYRANRGVDLNRDGLITASEAASLTVKQGFTSNARAPKAPTPANQLANAEAWALYYPGEPNPYLRATNTVSIASKPAKNDPVFAGSAVTNIRGALGTVQESTALNVELDLSNRKLLELPKAAEFAAKGTSTALEKTSDKIASATNSNFDYVIKQAENTKQKVSELQQLLESAFDQGLDRLLSGDFKGVFDTVKNLGKQLLSQTIKSAFSQNGGGISLGGASIPGIGPGGTAGFNGNAGLGIVNGSTTGLLNKIPFVNKLFSGSGVLSKIGAFFGLGGSTSAAAGGTAAAGGAASGGLLAGLFSNPVTAIAAAATMAIPLSMKLFEGEDNALKKTLRNVLTIPLIMKLFGYGRDLKDYRNLIKGEYNVDVKDNNVLKEIKKIGQENFGKEWKKRKLETIRLEPAKNIISNYADTTNQGNNKLALEKRKLDPYDSLNRYTIPIERREFGGDFAAGQAILVGERRAEVVAFDRPGTVYPSVANYQQTAGRSTGNVNLPIGLFQAILAEISALRQQMQPVNGDEYFLAKLQRNAEEVARTANNGQRGSGYAYDTLQAAGI